MALDTGAQGDGMCSASWAEKAGIKMYPNDTLLVLGDGQTENEANMACKVFLTFGSFTSKVESELIICSLCMDVDILVGDAWLKKNKVQLSYDNDTMVIHTEHRKHNITTMAETERARSFCRTPKIPDERLLNMVQK
jgi:hypothetical protein